MRMGTVATSNVRITIMVIMADTTATITGLTIIILVAALISSVAIRIFLVAETRISFRHLVCHLPTYKMTTILAFPRLDFIDQVMGITVRRDSLTSITQDDIVHRQDTMATISGHG